MKILFTILLFCISYSTFSQQDGELNKENCSCNDIPLHGDVYITDFRSNADFTVSIVDFGADMKVKVVENFPDKCGEWKFVEYQSFADFTVYITTFSSNADFTIEFDSHFPGMK